MLISFIIPVYNVELYLRECLESILLQTFTDYEIILINDGSIDSSGKICDEYAKKYSFIHVIHKKNGGLSDARNYGIENANGEYILFVDSDDYIGKNSLDDIVQCLKNSSLPIDVMFLEGMKVYKNGKIISLGDGYDNQKINFQSKEIVMKHLSSLKKYPGSACTKLIRRQLILENKLMFEKKLVSEDIEWTIRLFSIASNFAYCDTKYYYYRQNREGSITNTQSKKQIESLLYIMEKFSNNDKKINYQNEINAFLAYEYIMVLAIYAKMTKEEKLKYEFKLKKLSWILKYGKNSRVKLVYISTKLVGLNLTGKLLNIMYYFIRKKNELRIKEGA